MGCFVRYTTKTVVFPGKGVLPCSSEDKFCQLFRRERAWAITVHTDVDVAGTVPFTDEELARMFRACETPYGNGPGAWRFSWSGQDLADFIALSVYTGLRISDVATFHSDRLRPSGEIRVRTIKMGNAGKEVYTWVPEWLQERIRIRALQYGPYIFGEHKADIWASDSPERNIFGEERIRRSIGRGNHRVIIAIEQGALNFHPSGSNLR
jgi:integrase